MDINELFDAIQETLSVDDINGEFTLIDNEIIWTYSLTEEGDESPMVFNDEEDINNFDGSCGEEALQEGFREDYEKFELFLDSNNEIDNWVISESKINDDTITFKIS